jgi:hypothetical protein
MRGRLRRKPQAADWVHKNMPAKNTLIAADSDLVESAFKDKLASTQSTRASVEEAAGSVVGDGSAKASDQIFVDLMEASLAGPIILPQKPEPRRRRVAAKTIRLRDKEHCKFVATQPCVVCGRVPSEAHHIPSPNRAQSDARSVTNTRSPSVECITAIFTPTATKPLGGLLPASIRFP